MKSLCDDEQMKMMLKLNQEYLGFNYATTMRETKHHATIRKLEKKRHCERHIVNIRSLAHRKCYIANTKNLFVLLTLLLAFNLNDVITYENTNDDVIQRNIRNNFIVPVTLSTSLSSLNHYDDLPQEKVIAEQRKAFHIIQNTNPHNHNRNYEGPESHANVEQHQELEQKQHHSRLRKRSISGSRHRAAQLYDKFIAQCCENPSIKSTSATSDLSNQHRSSISKRDLTNLFSANHNPKQYHQLVTTIDSSKLPTCHQLASLWARFKFAYPSLAANLLVAMIQRERLQIPQTSSTSLASDLLLNHKEVGHLLEQVDKLLEQLNTADNNNNSIKQHQPQQQSQNQLQQNLAQIRRHQIERLLATPSYAKLMRQLQLREGTSIRAPTLDNGDLLASRKLHQPTTSSTTTTTLAPSMLDSDATSSSTSEHNDDISNLHHQASLLSRQQGIEPDVERFEVNTRLRDSSRGTNNNFSLDEVDNYGNKQAPIVARKPPSHISIGRIMYYPSDASPINSNGVADWSHRGTIEKLHTLHKNYKELENNQQQQQHQLMDLSSSMTEPSIGNDDRLATGNPYDKNIMLKKTMFNDDLENHQQQHMHSQRPRLQSNQADTSKSMSQITNNDDILDGEFR